MKGMENERLGQGEFGLVWFGLIRLVYVRAPFPFLIRSMDGNYAVYFNKLINVSNAIDPNMFV